MHNIEKYVTQFKREFHIHTLPTLDDLENIIVHKLYYRLTPYQGNEQLFVSLVKNNNIKCKTAVAVRCGDQRYIFYNDNIPPQDRPYIFAHEIAHIYLGHYSRDDGYLDTTYRKEQEANEFATLLLRKSKNSLIGCIVCAALIFLLAFCHFSPGFLKSYKLTTAVTEELFLTTINQYNLYTSGETVVVTSTGNRYHKKDCKHIKDRNNLKFILIDEALSDGYQPCLDCF